MRDRKLSTAAVTALVCAAGGALAAPTAYADPCGITGVTIEDESPIKLDASDTDEEIRKRRGATKNVGQEVVLRADTTGAPTGTVSFRWEVGGDVIDDYRESPAETTPASQPETQAVANPLTITEHANVAADHAVFTERGIRFYWRMRAATLPATVDVTLAVNEEGADKVPCAAASKSYRIERDKDDPDSQPEDFYTEINHGRRVLNEHLSWHSRHVCCTGYDGRLFPVFHSRFLANYDGFRSAFGYPAKGEYMPPDDLEPRDVDGYTLAHTPSEGPPGARVTKPRAAWRDVSGYLRPAWSTVAGGSSIARIDDRDCWWRLYPLPLRTKLADFDTLGELGCALESPWHNGIHTMIGGDMSSPARAPKDPIFWRWHGYLDGVLKQYPGAGGLTATLGPAPPIAAAAQARRRGPFCNGQRPTMRGTAGADVLRGTRRADVIWGGGGRDRIFGLDGNDIMCGGSGDDRLRGGAGFDAILGQRGADRVSGGRAGDELGGGRGRDRVSGGSGTDQAFGGAGRDTVRGGADDEWIVDGGAGRDWLEGGGGADTLHGGGGGDRLEGGGGPDTLDGGEGNDAIAGGPGQDALLYVDAEAGVRVDLGEGTATGDGRDRVEGVDQVHGSDHADTIEGGRGDETLDGGRGNDDITGGGGEDALHGGTGNDDVGGGGGDDYCAGEEDASRCED